MSAESANPTCGDCKRKVVDLLTYLELAVLPKLKGNAEKGLRNMIWSVRDAISFERKECAKLRASLAESTRLAEWWEEEHGREREARHAWVAWAREHGAIATGPDAEPEARKMLESRFSSGGKP